MHRAGEVHDKLEIFYVVFLKIKQVRKLKGPLLGLAIIPYCNESLRVYGH